MATRPFLTHHEVVLIVLARHSQITARKMAEMLGLAAWRMHRIIVKLEAEGSVSKQRVGGVHPSQVHVEKPLRRSIIQEVTVGEMRRGMRVVSWEEVEVPA